MALARRARGAEGFIWPGFVDGLATLLMVIIFVLMVFFLIQINLAQRVSGQDATLGQLRTEISELAELLNIERQKSGELAAANQQLALELDASKAEIEGLAGQVRNLELGLGEASTEADELRRQLADATERAAAAEEEASDIRTRLAGREAEISKLVDELSGRNESLGASQREIQTLTQSVEALRVKLGELEALLDEKEAEAREAKEVSVNLTQRLNDALSSKVVELQRFRSEFFGQLREILEDRSDIRIVGDRFVFQSEVLFDQGSADIGADGEAQLLELSDALREISAKIPSDIDWVLQVSGHTDTLPISSGRYRDNWDLSTDRALSVVRFLVLSGIMPDRLSATGFGEFQPIDPGGSPAALARNRRIEFKLTTRR